MKELKIFGETHQYHSTYEYEKDIDVLNTLLNEIKEPQILSYCGLETIEIYIEGDHNFICGDCIYWIYRQKKDEMKEDDIRECLLKCSIEDTGWTKQRNENLSGIFYRKITFLPEIQDMVCQEINKYITILRNFCDELAIENREKTEEREQLKSKWKVYRIFKKIMPSGGENGTDGYIDAEYISCRNEIVRMVSRDIFDVGCYNYPKRLEGNKDMLNRKLWTDSEDRLSKWLLEFGEFRGIRM